MLLDTDILVDLRRSHPPALAWIEALAQPPVVSGIAALEFAFGARDANELRDVAAFLRPLALLWPSPDRQQRALWHLAQLRLSHGVGLLDALTAAAAMGHGLAVATSNVGHHAAITGAATVQPYVR